MLNRLDIRLTIFIFTLSIILANFGISIVGVIVILILSMIASWVLIAPLRQLVQLAETLQDENDVIPHNKIRFATQEIKDLEETFQALNHRVHDLMGVEKEQQQELAEREQRYKIINDLISDYAAYVWLDEENNLYNGWMIGAYTEMLGFDVSPPNSPINLEKFIHPEDTSLVKQAIEDVINNKTTTCIYRARHKDGQYIWMEVTRQPVWSEDEQRVIGFHSAARNVSERMQTQRRLEEREQRYKIINDLISDYAAYVRVDKDGEFYNSWMLGPYTEMLGFDVPDLDAHIDLAQLIHPEDFAQVEQDIERLLDNETVTSIYRAKHSDGHYAWLEVTRQPVWDEDEQRVIGFYSATRNVTPRMKAQLQLEQNEEQYKRVSELMSDYAFKVSIDAAGNFVYDWQTGAYFDLVGYEKPPIGSSINLEDVIHPDDIEMVRADIKQVLENKVVTTTYREKHADGHYVWLEVTREPILDKEKGLVKSFYGAARNVTERMEAQLRVKESEIRFRAVANTSPVLIWMTDTSFETSYFNDAWLNFTGYSFDDETGDGWTENIHPDDYDRVLDVSKKGHETMVAFTMEYRLLRHDGEYRWIRDDAVPLFLENGEYAGFIGACIDITVQRDTQSELERLVMQKTQDLQDEIALRKNVELELIHERNLLQSTMKTSPTAIFVMSQDSTVKFANDSAHQLLSDPSSINETHIGNNPFRYMFDVNGDSFSEGESPLERTIQSNEALYNQEVIYKNDLSDARTLSLNLAPLSDAEGMMSEIVITAHDITLERKSKEQIKASFLEERKLNQIRSRFISTITHEFKTPLTVIKISCDIAKRSYSKMDKEQILFRFDTIAEQGKRLNALVDDVVNLNRTNNTEYTVLRESIEIPDFIRHVTDEILMAHANKTAIEYDFLPVHHSMNLDSTLTHQFLTNLIGNAVKYSHENTTVYISSHTVDDYLEIVIRDEGIGIPESDIVYLFEDFFRASNTEKIEGTGLGLVIAKRAIELQGGTITVHSVENEGTTFRILLPVYNFS